MYSFKIKIKMVKRVIKKIVFQGKTSFVLTEIKFLTIWTYLFKSVFRNHCFVFSKLFCLFLLGFEHTANTIWVKSLSFWRSKSCNYYWEVKPWNPKIKPSGAVIQRRGGWMGSQWVWVIAQFWKKYWFVTRQKSWKYTGPLLSIPLKA